jgi:diguanylate cyclase (GGDEF)-like protein
MEALINTQPLRAGPLNKVSWFNPSTNKIEFHPFILKRYSFLLLAPLILPHEWTHKLAPHSSLPAVVEEWLSYIMGVFPPLVILALIIGPYKKLTELIQKIEKLETLIVTDERTGLLNYRGFQYWLNSEIKRIDRYGGTFCLVMLDIDNFKEINDTYGHPCGDRVLEKLAEIIKANIRKTDILCRYGGEEFALIMPETKLEEAVIKKIKEKIIERVASTAIEIDEDKFIKITLSAGIASYPKQAEDGKELIKKADIALYCSKENGKNQLTAYQPTGNEKDNSRPPLMNDGGSIEVGFIRLASNEGKETVTLAEVEIGEAIIFRPYVQNMAEVTLLILRSLELVYPHLEDIRVEIVENNPYLGCWRESKALLDYEGLISNPYLLVLTLMHSVRYKLIWEFRKEKEVNPAIGEIYLLLEDLKFLDGLDRYAKEAVKRKLKSAGNLGESGNKFYYLWKAPEEKRLEGVISYVRQEFDEYRELLEDKSIEAIKEELAKLDGLFKKERKDSFLRNFVVRELRVDERFEILSLSLPCGDIFIFELKKIEEEDKEEAIRNNARQMLKWFINIYLNVGKKLLGHYRNSGKLEILNMAQRAFIRVIDILDSENVEAHIGLADVSFKMGEFEESAHGYLEAIKLRPLSSYYKELSKIYKLIGLDFDKINSHFDELSSCVRFYIKLAEVYRLQMP